MTDKVGSIGFFALWYGKASEYHAGREERAQTGGDINGAFEDARARGVRMFGRYGCRWSSERQYFTFWSCPSLEALEATMDDLDKAGDFKFAESEHIIGQLMPDEHQRDEDFLAHGEPGADFPIAFFAIWRRTEAHYHVAPALRASASQAIWQAFANARAAGARMLGRYDCRWSTRWDSFTCWLMPSFDVLETAMDELEAAGDFWFASSRHLIGNLESHFRSGRHLRVDLD